MDEDIFPAFLSIGAKPPRDDEGRVFLFQALQYIAGMALVLQFRTVEPATGKVPIDARGLLPERLRDLSISQIEKLNIRLGNRVLPLAELLTATGDSTDGVLVCEGDFSRVQHLGRGMAEGTIRITGDVGPHTGSQMLGGQITIEGDAADFLGAEMRGGRIFLAGNASDQCGGIYPGSRQGMTGGEILVAGRIGQHGGRRMRRGMLAVGGAEIGLGHEMLAGTIVISAPLPRNPGVGMKRGTILSLSGPDPSPGGPEQTLPLTFRHAARGLPTVIPLLLRYLAARDWKFPQLDADQAFEMFTGDHLHGGRGEIFVRC